MACIPVIFILVCPTIAYITFNPNCTSPTVSVNYVTSASTRGTLDILWSCLFTIIACTWTVQHLNVPLQREGRDPGILGDLKWALKRSLTTTKWMLVTVIAPEVLMGKYYTDISAARTDSKKLKKWADVDEVPWTLSHSLFANMGGFCLRTHAPERAGNQHIVSYKSPPESEYRGLEEDSVQRPTTPAYQETTAHDPLISNITSVIETEKGTADQSSINYPNVTNPYHLTMHTILILRESGALTRLPYLSINELQDRSKSDSLIRLIAIGQILWIIIQILARAVRHLAIAQLEITVLAFACCAVIMYGFNWNKPKAVGVPITILSYRRKAPLIVVRELFQSMEREDQALQTDVLDMVRKSLGILEKKGAPISNGFIRDTSDEISSVTNSRLNGAGLVLLLGSLVFGGIHLAAWNFAFPTRIEQVLWRGAALFCTCFFMIWILSFRLYRWLNKYAYLDKFFHDSTGLNMAMALTIIPALGLYCVARLYLVVEIFRTLCFLPPDAYIATWAANVPHAA